MRPAAVLFDAGNTLLFLDYERLAAGVGAALGVPLSASRLRDVAPAAALAMERREFRTDRDRGSAFLLELFDRAGVDAGLREPLRSALLALHREQHLWSGVDQRTPAALARLRDAGIRLGVISNSDGRAAEALEACGLLPYLEAVVDSALVGVEKPDPRIFLAGLQRMGLQANETMYVGDLYEVDVLGARAAGLHPVLLDPNGLHADLDVRRAPDVAALVDDLLRDAP
ncbi:MAG: HAD-IA family hydrolase [Gemmatimonadales bacterium]|nr:HAD-IA family hydrolase [Gemmatimonadales bacterium]